MSSLVSPLRIERSVSWIQTRQIAIFPEAEDLWCLRATYSPPQGAGSPSQRARALLLAPPAPSYLVRAEQRAGKRAESGREDLNLRSLGSEPSDLPG